MSDMESLIEVNRRIIEENERLTAENAKQKEELKTLAKIVKDMDDYINERGAHGGQ